MEIRPATREEIENAQAVGQPLPLMRLALDMCSCATEQEMNGNFEETLKRGYTPINGLLNTQSGTCSLIGSGPSIKETYRDLRGDVIAINSAIGFLLDHDVVPRFALLWDAAEIVEQFARPHPDVTYLVASRCHPKVFERLKDCKVIVWHAAGDHNIHSLVEKKALEPYPVMICGGSAGITRGLFMMQALGYRDIHIFGGDSSYSSNGSTHVRGSLVPEKDTMISIGANPPLWFRTTPEWAQQVNEYVSIFTLFTNGGFSTLEVYGEGTMLKTMHDLLVAKKKHMGEEKFFAEMMAQTVSQNEMNELASTNDPSVIKQDLQKTTQPLEDSNARV